MMYELEISERAKSDLRGIYEYIATELDAPKAALDFLDDVAVYYERIRGNPCLYEQCRNSRLQREGYRRAVIGSYILVYKAIEEDKKVEVHRFFYGQQNYMKLI